MTNSRLPEILTAVFAERTAPGRPAIVNLVGDPTMFRLGPMAGPESPPITLQTLANRELPARSVGRICRLLGRQLDELSLAGSTPGWSQALLPFLATFAGDWAGRLARQMGSRSALPFPETGPSPRFRNQYDACLRDAQQARRLVNQIGHTLMEGVKCPPKGSSLLDPPKMFLLDPGEGHVAVSWLSVDGKQLCRERLGQLAHRVCSSPRLRRLLDEARSVRSRQQAHWAAGRAHLRKACPELAEAVAYAVRHNRCVGHWIASAVVRGLPAEVYLFIDPTTPGRHYPRVSLVARRAHEEFVLGNSKRHFFYFPPVQLGAKIDFTAASPPWRVARPYVRMPPNCSAWRHPYTGSLKPDWFAHAELLTTAEREATVAVSDDASRLFPALADHALAGRNGVSDLCVCDQDLHVSQLVGKTCGGGWSRRERDLLGLVLGLWDMARIGLTRAHENNTHMPRVSLARGSMPYPISSPRALKKTRLAHRVFPYNPRASVR